ncbi:hypothetical protein [Pigmentiphaga sp.]|uniref:hypothetical protein n=1 Tax=Pigmentiphaga sp. TaxID=1977564 RepID=UPI00128D4B9C|nr:hypothetical protein [Pigmentiphaga sp.]MPS50810.1 hypothetical protein [Alcaligenaceae bacterium SAGV3]MPT56714.1 hypothetical protein [Alcaligenaceae bacterium]
MTAIAVMLLSAILAACGSGSGAKPEPEAGKVSGTVTYDFVPAVQSRGLDYAATRALPVRGAVVEAFSTAEILGSTVTDAQGGYSLVLPPGRDVKIRVQARLLRESKEGAWSVAIRDNTGPGYSAVPTNAPIYAMESEPLSVPRDGMVLDLHAASGWSGSNTAGKYAGARAAAPFSVLDQAYGAMQRFLAIAPDLNFPHLNIYWSENNTPSEGEPKNGDIGTSHFNPEGPAPGLYILGKANVDTDEYDTGVLVHEWGHYFEGRISRSDSVGGAHGAGDKLDMRVAWGEGWGNGLAGIVRNDPVYVDTSGARQQDSFFFDVSAPPAPPNDAAWYNEAAMQYFIYQLAQQPGGFETTIAILRNEQKLTPAFTSIFPFGTALATRLTDSTVIGKVNTLLTSIGTPTLDELNDWGGPASYTIPTVPAEVAKPYVRFDAPVAGAPAATQQICVSNLLGGEYNKLDQGRFLRLEVPGPGTYRLSAALVSPPALVTKAHIWLSRQGVKIQEDDEAVESALEAGTYTAFLVDTALSNGDGDDDEDGSSAPAPGPTPVPANTRVCYQVSLERTSAGAL